MHARQSPVLSRWSHALRVSCGGHAAVVELRSEGVSVWSRRPSPEFGGTLPALSAASSQLLPHPKPLHRPGCYDLRLSAAANASSKVLRAQRRANGSHSGHGSSIEYVD